ncbi:MAG TPA: glycosyltransferase family 2 protein, partial [Acidimicrobiia bacterium]|nr:glycosyltransferase family 2 protein [Acidimicrobiia bacterium]
RAAHLRPGPRPPWVLAEPHPAEPRPLDDIRLFCILGAWMEADVIAATVKNALMQGCESVYLVDNDSPDDTVAEAVRAGAVLAESFSTEKYDEVKRLEIMNGVVRTVSEAAGSEHIWWLWLDADEFPHGPRGLTVRDYLTGLDRRFRVVGSRFMNHFPGDEPAYVPGFHPLDFQPLCEEHRVGCQLGHRKHSLQRYDRSGPPILSDRGFHRATSSERPLLEPTEAIYLHHFPYRDPDVTRKRLSLLCATDTSGETRVQGDDDAADGMVPRFETLEAVYRGEWTKVRNYRFESDFSTARPEPWETLVDESELVPKLWYSREEREAAASAFRREPRGA